MANAALGSTPLSSPLESPDLIQSLLPFGEIGATTASVSSVKLSMDNIHLRNQQVRQFRPSTNVHTTSITSQIMSATAALTTMRKSSFRSNSGVRYTSALPGSISELPELNLSSSTKSQSQSCQEETDPSNYKASSDSRTIFDLPTFRLGQTTATMSSAANTLTSIDKIRNRMRSDSSSGSRDHMQAKNLVEFSLSSVGRSFIDSDNEGSSDQVFGGTGGSVKSVPTTLRTPDTPPPNVSPSSSNLQSGSETFSNDFAKRSPHRSLTPFEDQIVFKSGSWDLLELDLDFHQVNLDPSLGNIVEELVFFGDDPYGMLPSKPTEPNLLDL